MERLHTVQECRLQRKAWQGETLVLVPTMGALHEGHLTLVRHARAHGDRVIVSIFVNPLQFGPHEDYLRYPRPLEQDLAYCEAAGVDAVFAPTVEALYPHGQSDLTRVLPPAVITEQLCGLARPGHFVGVATVVLKLFNIIQPDKAVFGEKDAQQLAVLKAMVQDLNLPVELLPVPTVRESDGLALSSRNQYLQTEAERLAALGLSEILQRVQAAYQAAASLQGQDVLMEPILRDAVQGFAALGDSAAKAQFQLEYLQAVHRETFRPVERLDGQSKILIAARVGGVRLIDNLDLVPAY